MPTGTTATGIAVAKTAGYVWGVAVFEYLNLPAEQIAILGGLMVLDLATGVAKQYVIDPHGITSHRWWVGLIKKGVTLIIVLSIALVLVGLKMEDPAFAYLKSMVGLFIVAEFYSIVQNGYAVRTGEILPEFDAISKLLKFLQEILRQIIERAVTKPGQPIDIGERRKVARTDESVAFRRK